MARKRLSDLLRQEVKKPLETENSETTANAEGLESPPEASEPEEPTLDATPKPVEPVESPTLAEPMPEPVNPLESVVTELKADLEQSQQQVRSLEQQIADLQTQLTTQTDLIKTLQVDQQQISKLKAELKQAKATALKLAETNTKLTADLTALQQQAKQAPKPEEKVPSAQRATTPSSSTPLKQEIIHKQQMQTLTHPMFPNKSLPGHLSDQDLGWVD